MGDVKQIRRLQTAAQFNGSAGTVPVIKLSEHVNGGEYDLHPVAQYNGDTATLFLPAVDGPSFSIGIELDADTAGRLGRAFVGVQRKLEGKGDGEDA